MDALEVAPEALVEHGRTAFAARPLRHFLDLDLVGLEYLVCDEVDGPAAGVAHDELLTYI